MALPGWPEHKRAWCCARYRSEPSPRKLCVCSLPLSPCASRYLSASNSRTDRTEMWLASMLRKSCTTATMAMAPGRRRGLPTRRRPFGFDCLQGFAAVKTAFAVLSAGMVLLPPWQRHMSIHSVCAQNTLLDNRQGCDFHYGHSHTHYYVVHHAAYDCQAGLSNWKALFLWLSGADGGAAVLLARLAGRRTKNHGGSLACHIV